ncbi:MAG: nucleotidyltransferase family protein [Magnetococcales bacterium]|nr:nucleotidyltransferase family protein [Magnetococcales bacterium]
MTIKSSDPIPSEAVVLAGGLGKRLRQSVPDIPKPMAPIGDRPFLAHLLETLATQGIHRVILSVGYKSQYFIDYFANSFMGMEILYAIEDKPMGTAGGIRLGLDLVLGDRAFILNGDTFFAVPLMQLENTLIKNSARVVMAVKPMDNCARYGAVHVSEDEDGRIIGFREKGQVEAGLINGGVFLLSTDLRYDLVGCFSFETDFLQQQVGNMIMSAEIYDGYFIDIGIPEDYVAAQKFLVKQTQQVIV